MLARISLNLLSLRLHWAKIFVNPSLTTQQLSLSESPLLTSMMAIVLFVDNPAFARSE